MGKIEAESAYTRIDDGKRRKKQLKEAEIVDESDDLNEL